MAGEFMKPVFAVFGAVINFWWLWLIILVLGIWKFVDLIVMAVHHFKFT